MRVLRFDRAALSAVTMISLALFGALCGAVFGSFIGATAMARPVQAQAETEVDRAVQAIERLLANLDAEQRAAVIDRLLQGDLPAQTITEATPEPRQSAPTTASEAEAEAEAAAAQNASAAAEPVANAVPPEPARSPVSAPTPSAVANADHTPGLVITPKRCEWIVWLDSSGDGKVSGADRYWRHLYLWVDSNSNRVAEPSEASRLLDYDIRSIDLALRTYTKRKESVGDIAVDRQASFRLLGVKRKQPERATLVIDTDALQRSGPILEVAGEPLSGLHPLQPGMTLDRSKDPTTTSEQQRVRTLLTCDSGRP